MDRHKPRRSTIAGLAAQRATQFFTFYIIWLPQYRLDNTLQPKSTYPLRSQIHQQLGCDAALNVSFQGISWENTNTLQHHVRADPAYCYQMRIYFPALICLWPGFRVYEQYPMVNCSTLALDSTLSLHNLSSNIVDGPLVCYLISVLHSTDSRSASTSAP
jgi:hypothetical protein